MNTDVRGDGISYQKAKYTFILLPVQFTCHSGFQPIEISLDIALETSQPLFTTITIQSLVYFDI